MLILPLQVRMKVMKEDDEIEEYKDDHKGEEEGKENIRKKYIYPMSLQNISCSPTVTRN